MTDPSEDRDLSRAWRESSNEEPPARLDDPLRAAARVEVSARRAAAAPLRPSRTWWPLAAAAALATVIVGIVQLAPTEDRVPTVEPAAPSAAPKEDGPRAEPPTRETVAPPLPAPEPKPEQTAERRQADSTPRVAAAPRQREAEAGPTESRVAAATPAPETPAIAAAAAPPAAPAPAPASTPAPAAPAVAAAAADGTVDAFPGRAKMSAPAGSSLERGRPLAPSFTDWVAEIGKLLREGRPDDAKRELARLRERYPGREADLPPEVKALIEPR